MYLFIYLFISLLLFFLILLNTQSKQNGIPIFVYRVRKGDLYVFIRRLKNHLNRML